MVDTLNRVYTAVFAPLPKSLTSLLMIAITTTIVLSIVVMQVKLKPNRKALKFANTKTTVVPAVSIPLLSPFLLSQSKSFAYLSMSMQSCEDVPQLKPIVFACPTTSPQALLQMATDFAQARGFSIASLDQTSRPCLLCHGISSRRALQCILWSDRIMREVCTALITMGLVIVIKSQHEQALCAWFGTDTVSAERIRRSMPTGEVAILLRANVDMVENDDNLLEFQKLHRDVVPAGLYVAMLRRLCAADFVSAENEHFVDKDYYVKKVQAWSDLGHATVLERHTGVEYFALFRSGTCVLVSVGLYEATDRPCTPLFHFLHEGLPLQYTCGHDMLGVADVEGQQALRHVLSDVVPILGGSSMALIYAVSSSCVGEFRFVKVELCRPAQIPGGKLGDLSWIYRCTAAYDLVPIADENVLAKAMRAVHDKSLADDIAHLLEGDNVPIGLLLKYDVAKAVCAIPHQQAVNRLRYAALLSQRDLLVPTAAYARYNNVTCSSIIRSVDAEGRVVGRKRFIRGIVVFPLLVAAVSAYCISRDENVNSAEVLSTGIAIGTILLITLPQLYVECIGAGYSIGELYRGCVPTAAVMERKGVTFLKECVRKGANVEGVINGRHGCFLLGRARGGLTVGPVKVVDLDDRWDYGLNDRGVLCLRYRGIVGDMQVREREVNGKMCRWWHCAVVGSTIVKSVSKFEVLDLLGQGEIG